ncbi:MAG: hypothetical protein QOI86_1970 [Actinomycetota bacterium]|nr:hypothetical protein [Actinomycetota bacterium]
MAAAKESPGTQLLEWAVGKLDEASKTDWLEKFTSLTASKPAYLRNGLVPAASAHAPASSNRGVSQAELDDALSRADQAEARAAQADARTENLVKRVAQLEQQLAARNSHDDVELRTGEDDEHKTHWWSRH